MNPYSRKYACGSCGTKDFQTVIDYGSVPLAGEFPQSPHSGERYPLTILRCRNCHLMQTDSLIDPEALFLEYRYMSSTGLQAHFNQVAQILVDRFQLTSSHRVIEIGSNDGVLQVPMKELGVEVLGIEPAKNIAEIARERGCKTIDRFFSNTFAKQYSGHNSIDLVIANNCFAHIADVDDITAGIRHILNDEGHFVFEVAYARDIIDQLQFDNIYHEHIYYWTASALSTLLGRHGMTITYIERIPVHSGSLRVTATKGTFPMPRQVQDFLDEERASGLLEDTYYERFGSHVRAQIRLLKDYIEDLADRGFRVIGYGASGRANMLANLCEFGSREIAYVLDESPTRYGRYLAGTNIPIVQPNQATADDTDFVFLFAWNFAEMLIRKIKQRGSLAQFIVPMPTLQIVSDVHELVGYTGL